MRGTLARATCLSVVLFVCAGAALADQVIKGTLLAPAASAGFIRLSADGTVHSLRPARGAKIMRGQIGKDLQNASLTDFAAGDHVVALLDSNGRAVSLKAYYGRVQGIFKKLDGGTLTLDGGRRIPLAEQPQILLSDGRPGRLVDLKQGAAIVCRVNPVTGQAWTIVSAGSASPAESSVPTAASPGGEQIQIRSITFSAPNPLRPGDLLTVDLTGSPGCFASFQVRGLFAPTQMKEVSPGAYRAVVKVPADKPVRDAPLTGTLQSGKAKAGPIQASRLITVATDATASTVSPRTSGQRTSPVSRLPEPKAAGLAAGPAPPVAQVPDQAAAVTSATAASAATAQAASVQSIVITSPTDGSRIMRALTIKGRAEPRSRVQIEVTYNNGLTGILRLSGHAASQLAAVNDNGEFRLGPIPLEGPLGTPGLRFTIKVWYPDRAERSTARVVVFGDRT